LLIIYRRSSLFILIRLVYKAIGLSIEHSNTPREKRSFLPIIVDIGSYVALEKESIHEPFSAENVNNKGLSRLRRIVTSARISS